MATNMTVTIGRNVVRDGLVQPLDSQLWSRFRQSVGAVVDRYSEATFVDADYVGEWQDEEEEAHVWLSQLRRDDDETVNIIRDQARRLARSFGQDAVGFSVGQGELLRPDDFD